jgi:hypothetical protein
MTRSYTRNGVNEYTSVAAGQIAQDTVYGPRGNLIQDEGFDGEPDDDFLYTYDMENRLIQVDYDPDAPGGDPAEPVAEYRYDALGRRTVPLQSELENPAV